MPRQRRLSPGGQRGSGAGAAISGIGELLHSIFGGVAPNQDFGMQGPTPSGEALGGGNPYVAKSFLDRRDASNANADYFAQQQAADLDSSRRLTEESRLNPILGERETIVGGAKNQNEVARRRLLRPEDQQDLKIKNEEQVKLERLVQGIQMLAGKGVLPTQKNEQQYDIQGSPRAIDAAASGYEADDVANLLRKILNSQNVDATLSTAPQNLATARAKSSFNQRMAEGELGQFEDIFKSKMDTIRQEPVLRETEELRNRLLPLGKDTDLFDITTGNLSYESPSQFATDPATGKLTVNTGKQITQPQNTLPVGDLTADDLIIDPTTGKILGIKPRR
jgi:hypothetical protein